MLAAIPGVLDVSGGRNFSDKSEGVSHAMVVTLADQAALDVYGPHPNHDEVRALMMPLVERVSSVDREV